MDEQEPSIPDENDERRMFIGSVVAGGGINETASCVFESFKCLAHSINVGHGSEDRFITVADVGEVERVSSFPKPKSAGKKRLISYENGIRFILNCYKMGLKTIIVGTC